MIQLTRLRHDEPFFLNPDLFQRVDTHVDTVVRLIDGTEYVVSEHAEEIVRRIVEYRARILALAGMIQSSTLAGRAPGDVRVDVWADVDVAADSGTCDRFGPIALVRAPAAAPHPGPSDAGADAAGRQERS